MFKPGLVLIFSVLLFSCSDDNEDLTETVNKNGAVETAVEVTHLDSTHDMLTTSHRIWVKNGIYRTIVYRDTLPSLGITREVAENEDGDKRNVTVGKDYEIYITVK
jgi:hypothetical protein